VLEKSSSFCDILKWFLREVEIRMVDF